MVFELDINDDGADPKQGVQIAQSLTDKKIKFVMALQLGVTMPAARVLNDSGHRGADRGLEPCDHRDGLQQPVPALAPATTSWEPRWRPTPPRPED